MTVTGETIAPLKNVSIAVEALRMAMNRPDHLPGMAAMYGWSGLGKSFAASYARNRLDAYYIECRSIWTKRAMLEAMTLEMGIQPERTLSKLVDQVGEQLLLSEKPLIVDEMDHVVDKQAVNVIQDIYEISQSPMLLIGEENLPRKLARWEKFHNRILHWAPAQPSDVNDCDHLAKLYCRGVTIQRDLLEKITHISGGAARRIVVNLERVRQFADTEGLDAVDLARWGDRQLYTGHAPARRNQ